MAIRFIRGRMDMHPHRAMYSYDGRHGHGIRIVPDAVLALSAASWIIVAAKVLLIVDTPQQIVLEIARMSWHRKRKGGGS
jgi:preprotein translocase subunit Sec61beta